MAWPFTNVVQPNLDTGLVAVPTGVTAVDASSPIWLLGAMFSNPTAASITILVTNTAGDPIVPTMEVPAGLVLPLAFAFPACAGLKWQASGAGLKGQLWGYK